MKIRSVHSDRTLRTNVRRSSWLAVSAAVSPQWVLPCRPDDELTQLAVEAVRVGPFLGDQAPGPGQEGGGGDEAVAAQLAGQEPGQGGQECPVGPGWTGWAELAA
jgi:hypothetical protein